MSNLWEPSNIHALPTPNETILAKKAIGSLEVQLQSALDALLQAQHAVKTLQQKIEERRAWIAPIRHIPHDVLCLIFLEVCRMSWSAPLILGQVCHVWRESIIAYPRAWSYFQLQDKQSNELQSLFISRSALCSLHLRLPSHFDSHTSELFASVTERIQCLTLHVVQLWNLQGHLFPAMERLNFDGYGYADGDPGFILNRDLFPRLHSLDARSLLETITWDTPPFPNFVPLQVFSVIVRETNVWSNIVACCSQTLTSLRVILCRTSVNVPVPSRRIIALPRLGSLNIFHGHLSLPTRWNIDARTPGLQTYLEHSVDDGLIGPAHEDTQNVTSLHFDIGIDLSKFPQVRRMMPQNRVLDNVVEQLMKDPAICPNLHTIVYDNSSGDFIHAQNLIAVWNKQTGGKIQFRPYDDDTFLLPQFPRDLKCGYNMPCAHRP